MSNKTNTLDLVPVTFGAGDSKLFASSGNYFELIDCPNPVDVILSDRNGAQRARMKSAEASFYSKDVDFDTIQITSATAQTIRFAYGTGEAGTRRSTGSVTISGAIALDAATLLALETINVMPTQTTGDWQSGAALTLNLAVQIVAPATNTNGMIVDSAFLQAYLGAGYIAQAFISASAAPASIAGGDTILASRSAGFTGALVADGELKKPVYIAAGKGLYFISDATTAAHSAGAPNFRSCRYRLL